MPPKMLRIPLGEEVTIVCDGLGNLIPDPEWEPAPPINLGSEEFEFKPQIIMPAEPKTYTHYPELKRYYPELRVKLKEKEL
jgi:hypothetical protein